MRAGLTMSSRLFSISFSLFLFFFLSREYETEIRRLFHKEDSEFGVPKCVVYINLLNPIAYSSPRSTVLSALYAELVKDALNEYSYDASVAGLQYELTNTTKGLQLVFYGYNDVMPILMTKVTETMLTIANGNIDRYVLYFYILFFLHD